MSGVTVESAAKQAEVQRDQPSLHRVMGPGLLLLFIVGDILGTGVYALTGQVAARVGGAAWAPFLVAFFAATVTACSYLELVTKYPRAAGAALYAHKAFGIHFITFMIAFTVGQWLLNLIAIVQFLWLLFAREPNPFLVRFGTSLAVWLAEVARFLTCASEERPFPWRNWPNTPD